MILPMIFLRFVREGSFTIFNNFSRPRIQKSFLSLQSLKLLMNSGGRFRIKALKTKTLFLEIWKSLASSSRVFWGFFLEYLEISMAS